MYFACFRPLGVPLYAFGAKNTQSCLLSQQSHRLSKSVFRQPETPSKIGVFLLKCISDILQQPFYRIFRFLDDLRDLLSSLIQHYVLQEAVIILPINQR